MITILKEPQKLTPVYNQMILAATSSNFNETNFQFIADLEARGEFQTRLKIPANPEGYGVFDIHRHIQNKISFDFDPNFTGWNIATQSMATYSVTFSEEWRPEWDFIDNIFISGSYIGFRGIDVPPFVIGDEILIAQDEPYTEGSYNGIANVTDVFQLTSGPFTGQYVVATNKFFIQNTPVEGGLITLSNFRTKIFSTSASVSNVAAFNGVRSFVDFINWDYNEYKGATQSPAVGKFLTNMPNDYEVREDSLMWLNCYSDEDKALFQLEIETSSGDIFYNTNPFYPNFNQQIYSIAVGPGNFNYSPSELASQGWQISAGAFPIIKSSDDFYEIRVITANEELSLETYNININRKCTRYESIQLIFLDKLGSFIPYTFILVNRQTKNIKRNNYQKNFGTYAPASQAWDYLSYDRGVKNLDTVITESYTLNSDWVDQKTSDFLMTLFESPEVYWIRENDIVAINLTTTSIERKQTINEQVINYTLSFELSNKNSIQNG